MRSILTALLTIHAMVVQAPQTLELKHFEVIRVNPDDLRRLPNSLRSLFSDPVPDGELADSVQEAAKRTGFTPWLISGKMPERLFVTNGANQEIKISVATLSAALREAKVENVTVPAEWDGVVIHLEQRPGILVDYGDFYVAEAAPSKLSAPSGFPLPQAFEIMFRVIGLSASDARARRETFAANASIFLPIASRFDMDIRQVPLTSGPGLLLQNADKGGELAFMWSTRDRSYFLTGLVSEDQAIAIAKSIPSTTQ